MKDTYRHVGTEEVEGTLVAMPDASLRPHAVMVQLVYTPSTRTAVRISWAFPVITLLASFRVVQLVGFGLFLSFIYFLLIVGLIDLAV